MHFPSYRSLSRLIAALCLMTSLAAGAFLRDVPVTVRQPDGSILHCFATGDEFHNWLHDRDGFTIIQDPVSGYYMYAEKRSGGLSPSAIRPGHDDPRTAGIPASLNLTAEEIRLRRESAELYVPQGIALAPRTGVIQNVVIFIRFSDEEEFTDPPSKYTTLFNATGSSVNSLRNYFWEVSYERLEVYTTLFPAPTGATILSYQDTEPRAYYMPYSTTNPTGYTDSQRGTRERTLLTRAVESVTSQVPAGLAIDADNDGYVDNVCFIIKGTTTAWSTLLWPHMSSMGSSGPLLAGKKVAGYNFQLESMAQVSVLCHEMLHTLGAPDTYRYYSPDAITPVGRWDIMASTSNPPQHPGAYLRSRYLTWIGSIPRITASGRYSLKPVSLAPGRCYRIDSPNPGEFFLLEYRRKTSIFENSLPGEGLLVTRIDSLISGNASGPPDGVYVYRPGGNPGPAGPQNGTLNSAAFSSSTGRIAINDSTDPACYLTSGAVGNLDISEVGVAGDSIFFTVTIRSKSPEWSKVTVPVTNALNAISFPGTRAGWIAATSALLRSTNGGSTWTSLPNAPKTTLTALAALDSLTCWATGPSIIYKTTDGGTSWSSLSVTVPSGGRLNGITMVSPQSGWAVASGGVIYKTTDGGNRWVLVPAGVTVQLNAVSFLDPARGWIVGGAGTFLQTSDSGLTWSQRPIPDTTTLLSVAFVDSVTGVSVGRLGRIFKTTNGGSTWSLRPVNTRAHLNAVRFLGRDSGWAVGESGTILRTTDSGATWTGTISGTMVSLRGIAALDGRTQFVAGATGVVLRSIWPTPTGLDREPIGMPIQTELAQNYPNPFNPGTTIRYTIAQGLGQGGGARNVELVVYDLLGRQVAVLVNAMQAPGEYDVRFDGSRYASGMYVYRLSVAGTAHARRMLLLR